MAVDCAAVQQRLKEMTGWITDDVFRKTARSQPIIGLQMSTRGTWEYGMGDTMSNMVSQRNYPSDPLLYRRQRTSSNSNGAGGNSCLPTVTLIKEGQETQSFFLRDAAFQTREYCLRDILTARNFSKVLGNITKQLADVSDWVWAEWFMKDYYDIAGHNVTQQLGGTDDQSSGGYGDVPTGRFNWGTAEDIWQAVYREGGDQPIGYDVDTDSPVFALLLSRESINNIFRDNDNLRNDMRYATMGKGFSGADANPALPYGAPKKRRQFGGFVFYEVPYPRRFTYSAGAYTQVPVWLESNAGTGTKTNLNPAWKSAPYEESIFWHGSGYRSLVPKPMSTPSPGWNFDPVSFMGDFQLLNIHEKTCNPRGENVFWDAQFSDAAEPLNPEVMYTYLHLRCGFDIRSSSCSASGNYSSSN